MRIRFLRNILELKTTLIFSDLPLLILLNESKALIPFALSENDIIDIMANPERNIKYQKGVRFRRHQEKPTVYEEQSRKRRMEQSGNVCGCSRLIYMKFQPA